MSPEMAAAAYLLLLGFTAAAWLMAKFGIVGWSA